MNTKWTRILCALPLLSVSIPTAFATEPGVMGSLQRVDKLQISTPGDLEMACGDLSVEAAKMRDIIYALQDVKNSSEMQSHGVTAAGAVGSFLIGTVTGGIGLAVGGFLIDSGIEGKEEHADEAQDIAEQRRTLMMGIYNAKGCYGPLEHAMQNPEKFDPLSELAYSDGPVYQTELRRRYNN